MGILDLVSDSLNIGVVIVVSLIALAARELVATKDSIYYTNLIKFLNISTTIMVVLFLYLFASTVIAILSIP